MITRKVNNSNNNNSFNVLRKHGECTGELSEVMHKYKQFVCKFIKVLNSFYCINFIL
jgi:hypothetical protein